MKKILLAVMAISFVFVLSACGKSSPDPNRTRESCNYFGEVPVYPDYHNKGYCYRDGDGYYWPGFGHHHHK